MDHTNTLLVAAVSIVVIIGGAVLLARRFGKNISAAGLDNPERLARLVLAEIAMYHGRALDDARASNTVYRLVKDDFERSRKMFLQRYPQSADVWESAVVAVLAHGEPERLGADYPYRR
jgi:hypothetical protein